jgi:predicted peptidase
MKRFITLILTLLICFASLAQMTRTEKVYKDMRYLEFMPKKWNGHVILFLHGLGERGSDITLIEKLPIPKLFKSGFETEYIVIAPQLPTSIGSWGRNQIAILKEVVDSYRGVPHITGLSLGGIGTLSALRYYPGYWKTAGVVCGKADATADLSYIVPTRLRAWHGTADKTVTISSIRQIVPKVNELGGKADLIEYFNVTHNAWDRAYSTTDPESYWAWMDQVSGAKLPDMVVTQYVLNNILYFITESGKRYQFPVQQN